MGEVLMEAGEIDPVSRLILVDTDQTIAELDEALANQGWTLNFHGIPHNDYLLAEVLNQRLPNLYGDAFGGIEEICLQIRLAQPDGSLWMNRLTPRSATGPDLKKIAIGSDEMLGIPVQSILRICPLPEKTRTAVVLFSGEQPRELFLQFIKKYRLKIPLKIFLKPAQVQIFLKEKVAGIYPIGLAFWGTVEDVEMMESLLEEKIQNQKGEIFWIEDDESEEDFLEFLHEQAIAAWKTESESSPPAPDAPYRKLAKKIKEIS